MSAMQSFPRADNGSDKILFHTWVHADGNGQVQHRHIKHIGGKHILPRLRCQRFRQTVPTPISFLPFSTSHEPLGLIQKKRFIFIDTRSKKDISCLCTPKAEK